MDLCIEQFNFKYNFNKNFSNSFNSKEHCICKINFKNQTNMMEDNYLQNIVKFKIQKLNM